LLERCKARLIFRIVSGADHEHADAPRPLSRLSVYTERPRCHRSTYEPSELPPPHPAPQFTLKGISLADDAISSLAIAAPH